MKHVLKILLLAAWLAVGMARAETINIPVDGESWSMTFDAPALKTMPLPFRPRGFAYFGNAGRLNISFFVESPACAGGEEPSVRLACFSANLPRNPYIVQESVRSSTTQDGGVFVVYGMRVPFKGALLRQLHMHRLFYQSGREIDFHASWIEPTEADASEMNSIIESVRALPK